jgi:hypothetical protein
MKRDILEELLTNIERNAKNNMATITDVELFVSSWRKEAINFTHSYMTLNKKNKMNIKELKLELLKFLKAYRNFANELKNKGNEKGIVDIYISNYKEFNDL